jgi:hypothetical protein
VCARTRGAGSAHLLAVWKPAQPRDFAWVTALQRQAGIRKRVWSAVASQGQRSLAQAPGGTQSCSVTYLHLPICWHRLSL